MSAKYSALQRAEIAHVLKDLISKSHPAARAMLRDLAFELCKVFGEASSTFLPRTWLAACGFDEKEENRIYTEYLTWKVGQASPAGKQAAVKMLASETQRRQRKIK